MAVLTKSFLYIILLPLHNSFAEKGLKDRINAMEKRLDELETRLNTDNVRTRSDIAFLENLNSTCRDMTDKMSALFNESQHVQPSITHVSNNDKTETSVCDRDKVTLFKGFANEKKWLKNKIRNTETFLVLVRDTTQNNMDAVHKELALVNEAFNAFSATVETQRNKQDSTFYAFSESVEKEIKELKAQLNVALSKIRDIESEHGDILPEFQRIDDKNSTCPNRWKKFNKRCYLYHSDTRRTFRAARRACQKYNAYIADFENHQESEFIHSLTGGYTMIWTGITDNKEEGVWISERTNKAIEYTNWMPGDPDGHDSQNCVMTGWRSDWHEWIDAPCRNEYSFVCKKDAIYNE